MSESTSVTRFLGLLRLSAKSRAAGSISYLVLLSIQRAALLPVELGTFVHALGILALSSSFVDAICSGYDWALERVKHRRLLSYLSELSPAQRGIFQEYIYKNRRAVSFRIDSGEINHLEDMGFFYRATMIASPAAPRSFSYVIQPWVWKYLNQNRYLVKTEDVLVGWVGGDNFSGIEVNSASGA